MAFRLPNIGRAIPPLDRARVRGPIAKPIFDFAASAGVDTDRLRAEAGLATGVGPDADIGVADHLALLLAGERLLGDPLFGLHVGLEMRPTDIPAYGMALCACLRVGTALRLMQRYESMAHDLGRCLLSFESDMVRLRVHSPWFDLPGGRHLVEMMGSGFRTHADWLVGRRLPALEVRSPFGPAPGVDPEHYARIIGVPVVFGAQHAELTFAAEMLDWRFASAESGMFAPLVHWAEQHFVRHKRAEERGVFIEQVRAHLRAALAAGRADLFGTAEALGMAPRTLQRRLIEHGTSLSDLLDDVRIESVHALMDDSTLPFGEVARRLGFRNQSSFNHAYRGWFGTTPTEARERAPRFAAF
ncbi:MAG: AraC family transcriptional regulator [Siculibacillus sp.]|nr:AraC family transcriptional regulator [Siculibacillus sp.]